MLLLTSERNVVLQEVAFHKANTLLADDNQVVVPGRRHVSHETVNV